MLTLREVSDRLEIQDVLHAYSDAVDARDWDALDRVFTSDAFIDYSEMTNGVKGDLKTIKTYLAHVFEEFGASQHMVANTRIVLDGDRARARSICHNPMLLKEFNGAPHVFFCGLWYRDSLVRTAEGWRIRERYEEQAYFYNFPPELAERFQSEAALGRLGL